MQRPPPSRIDLPDCMLRAWTPRDAHRLRMVLQASDAHLRLFTPWVVDGRVPGETIEDRLAQHAEHFAAGVEWVYGIFSPDESAILGGCGMYTRVGPDAIELGYWLASDQTGRGLAKRASAVLTRLAFASPEIDRVEIRCDRLNVASMRIPERLGFHVTANPVVAARPDLVVWELRRDQVDSSIDQ